MNTQRTPDTREPRDLLVLSDAHVHARSPSAVAQALAALFLDPAGGGAAPGLPVRAVLAGDFFDFSMVSETPRPQEAPFAVSRGERRFGLEPDGPRTAWKIDRIFRAHPGLLDAMTRFLDRGNDLVFLPGNHDEELLLPEVQQHLRERLGAPAGGEGSPEERGRVLFAPWFHHEPGFAYVEHGHFHDPDNAPASPVRPCPLPPGSEVALPLGALVTRYLLSVLDGYDSRGDSDRTPWPLLVKVVRDHGLRAPGIILRYYAMAVRVLRTARARGKQGAAPPGETPDRFARRAEVNRGQLARLLSLVPPSTTRSVRQTLSRLYLDRSAAFAAFVATALLLLPRLGEAPSWGLGLPAASLGLLLFTLRTGNRFGNKTGDSCREAARRIQEILDVPWVVMGHTHRAETRVRTSPGGARSSYVNTGSFCESVLEDGGGRPCVVLRRPATMRPGTAPPPRSPTEGSPGSFG